LWSKSIEHEEHPEELTALLQKAIHYLFPANECSSYVRLLFFFLLSGVAGAYFKVLTDTMIITLMFVFCDLDLLPVVYLLLTKRQPF
jgi:hypothetical protein